MDRFDLTDVISYQRMQCFMEENFISNSSVEFEIKVYTTVLSIMEITCRLANSRDCCGDFFQSKNIRTA